MTDPTEAIRKALKTYDDLLAAGEAMPVAFNESGLIKFLHVFSIRALLDRLDSAERDAGRYRWTLHQTLHHLGLIESHAMQWRPSKHKPLIDYLQDFIEAALRAGEQKEPK